VLNFVTIFYLIFIKNKKIKVNNYNNSGDCHELVLLNDEANTPALFGVLGDGTQEVRVRHAIPNKSGGTLTRPPNSSAAFGVELGSVGGKPRLP